MHKSRHLSTSKVTAILVCAVLVTTWGFRALQGAPILPDVMKMDLSDEDKMLRGLEDLAVTVAQFPPELKVGEELAGEIRRMVRADLRTAGISVHDREGDRTARLSLQLRTAQDDNQPDAIAIVFVLSVHQPVTVDRLKT